MARKHRVDAVAEQQRLEDRAQPRGDSVVRRVLLSLDDGAVDADEEPGRHGPVDRSEVGGEPVAEGGTGRRVVLRGDHGDVDCRQEDVTHALEGEDAAPSPFPVSKLYQNTPLPFSCTRMGGRGRRSASAAYFAAMQALLTGVLKRLAVGMPHSPPESDPPFHQLGDHIAPAPDGSLEPSCDDG